MNKDLDQKKKKNENLLILDENLSGYSKIALEKNN